MGRSNKRQEKWIVKTRQRCREDISSLWLVSGAIPAPDEIRAIRNCSLTVQKLKAERDFAAAIALIFLMVVTLVGPIAMAVLVSTGAFQYLKLRAALSTEALVGIALSTAVLAPFAFIQLSTLLDLMTSRPTRRGLVASTAIFCLATALVYVFCDTYLPESKVVAGIRFCSLCAILVICSLFCTIYACVAFLSIYDYCKTRPLLHCRAAYYLVTCLRRYRSENKLYGPMGSSQEALQSLEKAARILEIDMVKALLVNNPASDSQLATLMSKKSAYLRTFRHFILEGTSESHSKLESEIRKSFFSIFERRFADIPEVDPVGRTRHERRLAIWARCWTCLVSCFPPLAAVCWKCISPASVPTAITDWIIPVSILWIFIVLWTTIDPLAADRMDGLKKLGAAINSIRKGD